VAEEKSADAKAAEAAKKELADEKAHEKAKEKFERRSALTVAILAAICAYTTLCAGNSGGDGTLGATQTADKWAQFQSNSMKGHEYELQRDFVAILNAGAIDETKRTAFVANAAKALEKYDKKKEETKAEAEKLEKQVVESGRKSGNYGVASLLLQIAIVIVSISIIVRQSWLYFGGTLVGLAGFVIFLLTLAGAKFALSLPY